MDTQHGFMTQRDALSIGMTTALRRGYNGKQPRTRYTSATKREGTSANVKVSYMDGTSEIRSASSFRVKSDKSARPVNRAAQNMRQHYIDQQIMSLPSIHV